MKKTVAMLLVILMIMVLIPMTVFLKAPGGENSAPTEPETDKYGSVRVYLTNENKTVSVTMSEYLTGAVAAEMPVSYHAEALKAQAAVCFTYIMKAKGEAQNSENLPDNADISDDSTRHQGYMPQSVRREKFGNSFEASEEKLSQAVSAVIGKGIFWGGELITAAYHAISSGRTEDSENIWGGRLEYLRSVQSQGDKLSPDFTSEVSVPFAQFKEKVQASGDAVLNDDPSEWITAPERTSAGSVKKITVGGKDFTGMQIREIFSLRSPCFTITYEDGAFLFKVSGYGHGCGMSQYGADYMARQGSDWQAIIRHYYTGVTIDEMP